MNILAQTYLGDILHDVAQALLLPDVAALLLFVLYAVWCIGSIIVEACSSRRRFKVVVPQFLEQITQASPTDIVEVVEKSGLLGNQKKALLTLWEYRNLPVDAHVALAKRIVDEQESHLNSITSRTSTASKIAPMLGLMGTLIPLGPGLISLGQGDTLTLSNSLLIAFDTTVAGLIVSLVTFVITRIRKHWYDNYLSALDAAVTTMLEKVEYMREHNMLGAMPSHAASVNGMQAHGAPARDTKVSAAKERNKKSQGSSAHSA